MSNTYKRASPLYAAAMHGKNGDVQTLLNRGLDPNMRTKGFTPLFAAAQNNHMDTIKMLLSSGADVNMVNGSKQTTALLVAAQKGHCEIVQLLLDAGGDPNIGSAANGNSPLYTAAFGGHEGCVKALIHHGADVNKAIKTGHTPLFVAAQNNHVSVLKLLLQKGADPNRQTPADGTTPLYIAAQYGHAECVRTLLKFGADPSLAHKNGYSPLEVAYKNNHKDVQVLLEAKTKRSSNIFLVSGHGWESPTRFYRRKRMPKDKTLVVFAACGEETYLTQTCRLFDMFNDPQYKQWLDDPITYTEEISRLLKIPIRVYLPGDYVPNMYTNLFYNIEEVKGEIRFTKSGVYPIQGIPPIDRSILRSPSPPKIFDPLCTSFVGVIDEATPYTAKIHRAIFKGNIYKPASKMDSYDDLSYRYFDMMDIMKDVGPGIYYYIGCRTLLDDEDNQIPRNWYVLNASAEQQRRSTVEEGMDRLQILGSV